MRNNKHTIRHLFFRVICCLLSGLLVSMALMGTMDTYSWFTSTMTRGIEVSAAGLSDILDYKVEYLMKNDPKKENPIRLDLTGSTALTYDPVIYFAVQGEAAQYILHINPVRLKNGQVSEVPIKISVNMKKFSEIKKGDIITGTIFIKYLNEFIDVPLDIKFTGEYLLDQAKEKLESSKEFTEVIMKIAKESVWEEASWSKESGEPNNSVMRMMTFNGVEGKASLNSLNAPLEEGVETELKTIDMPISQLMISEEQKQILDIIVPKASEYLQEIYNEVRDLVNQVDEQMQVIAKLRDREETLTEQVSGLESEKETLLGEKENLLAQVDEITKANTEYQDRIVSLENENQNLRRQIAIMEEEISILQSQSSIVSPGGGGSPAVIGPNNGQNPDGQPVDTQPGTGTGQTPGELPIDPINGANPGNDQNPVEQPGDAQPGTGTGQTSGELPIDPTNGANPGNDQNPVEQPGDVQPNTGTGDQTGTTPTVETPAEPTTDQTVSPNPNPVDNTTLPSEEQENQEQTSDNQQESQEPVEQNTVNPVVEKQTTGSVNETTALDSQDVKSTPAKDKSEKIHDDGIGSLKLDMNKKEEDEETYLPK